MKRRTNARRHAAACLLAGFAVTNAATAQDVLQTLSPLTVVGSQDAIWNLAGSAAFVDAVEIRRQGHTNINQVLAKVPGVYVREEDGFGNFPNISIRGGDGTRSAKVTVMEDGILSAPAPYSAPAAYYTPRVARMSGVEILKGSSQVRYGPQTTGGVINYLSTPIPAGPAFYSRNTYGSHHTFLSHTHFGNTVETDSGTFGYLFEFLGQTSDGFRKIDGFSSNTGFTLIEPMLKLSFEPKTALKQRFEFKAGYTSFDADETYVGLKETDLRANPDRRYAGTFADTIETEHYRSFLKWIAEPSDALRIESAVYYNNFDRDWFKADRANGRNIHEVLAPTYLPAQAAANQLAYDVLRGAAPGTIRVKGNAREYNSFGWQNQVNLAFETGAINHDLAVGLRLHRDEERRDQYFTTYQGDGFGGFSPIPGMIRVPIFNENDRSRTFATAVFVEDTMRIGQLVLKPGFRYEWLDLDYRDFNTPTNNLSGSSNFYTAGIGGTYELSESDSVFGGVHRGIALPGVRSAIRPVNRVNEEESISYELGYRHRGQAWGAEVAAFFTDFNNLISTDTGVGGINNQNAGAAEVWGFESAIQYDPALAAGMAFGLPMYLSATWTSAEFKGTTAALAGGGDGLYAGGRDGNEIPYVPEWKLAAGIGYRAASWGVNFDGYYTAATWGTGYNADVRPGTPTSRDGRIPEMILFDLTGHYQLNEHIKLVGGVQNIFDERKLVSRIPEGPRANAPRMLFAGFEATF